MFTHFLLRPIRPMHPAATHFIYSDGETREGHDYARAKPPRNPRTIDRQTANKRRKNFDGVIRDGGRSCRREGKKSLFAVPETQPRRSVTGGRPVPQRPAANNKSGCSRDNMPLQQAGIYPLPHPAARPGWLAGWLSSMRPGTAESSGMSITKSEHGHSSM